MIQMGHAVIWSSGCYFGSNDLYHSDGRYTPVTGITVYKIPCEYAVFCARWSSFTTPKSDKISLEGYV